jgi:hypothetical protein
MIDLKDGRSFSSTLSSSDPALASSNVTGCQSKVLEILIEIETLCGPDILPKTPLYEHP